MRKSSCWKGAASALGLKENESPRNLDQLRNGEEVRDYLSRAKQYHAFLAWHSERWDRTTNRTDLVNQFDTEAWDSKLKGRLSAELVELRLLRDYYDSEERPSLDSDDQITLICDSGTPEYAEVLHDILKKHGRNMFPHGCPALVAPGASPEAKAVVRLDNIDATDVKTYRTGLKKFWDYLVDLKVPDEIVFGLTGGFKMNSAMMALAAMCHHLTQSERAKTSHSEAPSVRCCYVHAQSDGLSWLSFQPLAAEQYEMINVVLDTEFSGGPPPPRPDTAA